MPLKGCASYIFKTEMHSCIILEYLKADRMVYL